MPAGRPRVCGESSLTLTVWSYAGVPPVETMCAWNTIGSLMSWASEIRTSLRRIRVPESMKFTSDQSAVALALTVTSSSCCRV